MAGRGALVTRCRIGCAARSGPRLRTLRFERSRPMTIRNPIEWATDQIKLAGLVVGSASRAGVGTEEDVKAPLPEVRCIGVADLRVILARGFDDFATYRTDVIFL